MKRSFNIFLVSLMLLFSCSQRTVEPTEDNYIPLISAYGNENSFDIATWNIENFPIAGSATLNFVKRIINDSKIDLFAVQEIDDPYSFSRLLDSLPDFSGTVSSLPSSYLKLGIIYKHDFISVSNVSQIFVGDYDFPRPPLVAFVEVKENNTVVFDFILIVNHLKAFGDSESEERRRNACIKLKDYIDTSILSGSEKDVIVLGDLNDEIDVPPADNVFTVFLDDSNNYRFLTADLSSQYSYPGYNSLIDHILITSDSQAEYTGGEIRILSLDKEFPEYSTEVSDHRPVMARFPVFNN